MAIVESEPAIGHHHPQALPLEDSCSTGQGFPYRGALNIQGVDARRSCIAHADAEVVFPIRHGNLPFRTRLHSNKGILPLVGHSVAIPPLSAVVDVPTEAESVSFCKDGSVVGAVTIGRRCAGVLKIDLRGQCRRWVIRDYERV